MNVILLEHWGYMGATGAWNPMLLKHLKEEGSQTYRGKQRRLTQKQRCRVGYSGLHSMESCKECWSCWNLEGFSLHPSRSWISVNEIRKQVKGGWERTFWGTGLVVAIHQKHQSQHCWCQVLHADVTPQEEHYASAVFLPPNPQPQVDHEKAGKFQPKEQPIKCLLTTLQKPPVRKQKLSRVGGTSKQTGWLGQ